MHFWIDKRSQCGFNGRHRVPSSLSTGVGRSRGRVGVGVGRKGMVTPVHRFQAVDCVPPPRVRRTSYRYYGPAPLAGVHSCGARRGGSVCVALPEPPTLQALAAQRSVTPDTLLRTAALGLHQPPPLMAPHLKCGMWASFALATLFVAGAKFYFDHQARVLRGGGAGGGGEAGAVCAVVGALVVCGCALSLCRARPAPAAPPDRVSSTAHRPPHSPTTEPSDDISLGTLLQTVSSERDPPPPVTPPTPPAAGEAPPPPYHIAVLLPASAAPDPPPPAYSALS